MKILFIAPHVDDVELGCGGTIARLADEKHQLFYVALSDCQKSIPEGLPADTLQKELYMSAETLGLPSSHVKLYNYQVREFSDSRQKILDDFLRLKSEIAPDLVFVPATGDLHQDHGVVTNEGLRAFKHSSILGYELPWNHTCFKSNGFYKLDEKHMSKKIESLKQYQSQKHRSYFNHEVIYGLARLRGVQSQALYAEAFEVIRWIQ